MTAPLPKRRILIIDDQESIHQDYRKIMAATPPAHLELAAAEAELFGNVAEESSAADWNLYEIDSAFQGAEAVSLVRQARNEGRPYSVAFADIRMPPGCDGIETVRQIWEIDPEVLVVICSAYSDYDWQDMMSALGRTDRFLVLRKPFENIEVRQCAAALSERWMIARSDVLTGLLNRRVFDEILHREWAHAMRYGEPLCCIMLDIDYFKTINDRFGHAAGDHALKALANVVMKAKRPADTVCRYGGEEICVLLPNTDEDDGCLWAESLRAEISRLLILPDAPDVRVTASFGVAVATPATSAALQLVREADAGLMRAKQTGRDRVIRGTQNHFLEEVDQAREEIPLFQGVLAHEIMTSHVTCVCDDMSVAEAAELLLQSRLNCAPVVDRAGQLVGVISEKDLMELLGVQSGWSVQVKSRMTTRVIQYAPSTPAQVVFDFLCRVQLRRVIITEDGKPVGIISRGSFLRWIRNLLKTEQSDLARLDSRPQLLKAAQSLTRRSLRLESDLERCDDVVAPVVCGVSSIEMLLGDLLNWAGSSQSRKEGDKFAECL